jgi:hypothetical protein
MKSEQAKRLKELELKMAPAEPEPDDVVLKDIASRIWYSLLANVKPMSP